MSGLRFVLTAASSISAGVSSVSARDGSPGTAYHPVPGACFFRVIPGVSRTLGFVEIFWRRFDGFPCCRRQVVRNVVFEPRLLPGGGATEMAVSQALTKKGQVDPKRVVSWMPWRGLARACRGMWWRGVC